MHNVQQLKSAAAPKPVHALLLVLLTAACGGGGCTQDRRAGQVELFGVTAGDQRLYRFLTPGETPAAVAERTQAVAGPGDPVRFNSDVLTLQVHSVHLDRLPVTLTGSRDVVVFTEVWENAVESQAVPLTSIVYTARNQRIPGLLNFTNAMAYGATRFKGSPLKIKFTIMVLQKRESERQRSAVDVIENIATTAAPQYGMLVSGASRLIRDILAAQPDVVAFDYELTLASDRPEALIPRLRTGPAPEVAVLGGPPTPAATMYDRRAWLRYGDYAVVETSRGRATGGAAAPNLMPAASHVQYRGGMLYAVGEAPDVDDDDDVTAGGTPLKANYLVFSITPEQLAQDDEVLEEAGRRTLATLQSLRRSGADVADAIRRVVEDTGFLIKSALRVKIEQLADRAAREARSVHQRDPQKAEKAEFERRFATSFARLKQGLREEDQEAADAVYKDVLAARNAVYDAVTPGPTTRDSGGDTTTGNNTFGNDATGNDTTGDDTTGNDTAGAPDEPDNIIPGDGPAAPATGDGLGPAPDDGQAGDGEGRPDAAAPAVTPGTRGGEADRNK